MKEEQEKYIPNDDSEQEIDLLELAKKIWASRGFVLKFCLYGLIVGLVVAFSIPKEYTTTIKLAPEVASGKRPEAILEPWLHLPVFLPWEVLPRQSIRSFIQTLLPPSHFR